MNLEDLSAYSHEAAEDIRFQVTSNLQRNVDAEGWLGEKLSDVASYCGLDEAVVFAVFMELIERGDLALEAYGTDLRWRWRGPERSERGVGH